MGAEQNGIWRDTTDLMVYGHEGWLELTGSHGHEGKDFEVHFKYGHNLRPDGLTRKEGLKAWLANPDGEVNEINLAVGGLEHYSLTFPTISEGFYQVVAVNNSNYAISKGGKYLLGTRREYPDADKSISYNQYAQVFLPVGHDLEGVPRPAGIPLEIVAPSWKPWRAGDKISLQIIFRGEPLDGAAIDIAYNGPAGYRQRQIMTDAEGRINLTADDPGYYLIVVRHQVPESEVGVYDEKSFTTTLWFMVTK
jgi:uncharacterized GH25 family protein